MQGSTASLGSGREITFVGYEKRSKSGEPTYDVGLVIGVGGVKLGTYVGLGRMVGFAALARDAVVESSVFEGRVVEVYRFVADLGAYGLVTAPLSTWVYLATAWRFIPMSKM